MEDNEDKIKILLEKLEKLLIKQQVFSIEVEELKKEIYKLKASRIVSDKEVTTLKEVDSVAKEEEKEEEVVKKEEVEAPKKVHSMAQVIEPPKKVVPTINKAPKVKTDLEKFIGENLINKIGIAITVIGVSIGAKYSIEHDLISPLTRIILGYLVGLGLLGFGIKLKEKYLDYSAVLVSGAMAILYFITFAAYDLYGLFPQIVTFILMLLFTVFTVVAAINYNKQIIAHIGLVGAYAVPFLLSTGSGRVDILFSYMLIINIGILIIAFKKDWKPLYYSAFILTWFIYAIWYFSEYIQDIHFALAFTFLILFFLVFYAMLLSYKILQKEKFVKTDIILLLSNSFTFFGLGYSILSNHEIGGQLLGIFTLCNAVLHFIVSMVIYKQKLADRNLFFLISGLVLVFLTVAIPIQLDGNWVTLLWAGEAVILFWIGRTKNVPVYEKLSYPLMVLAVFSIVHDWSFVYNSYRPNFPATRMTPFINRNFLSSLVFIAAFAFINYINNQKKYISPLVNKKGVLLLISYAIPTILLFVTYSIFKIEIDIYWNQLYTDSVIKIKPEGEGYMNYFYNHDYVNYKVIWNVNYALLFLTILSFVNIKYLKNKVLGYVNLIFNVSTIAIFLIVGLYVISELRETYLNNTLSEYYQRSSLNIGIRYISYVFVIALFIACYKYIRQKFMDVNLYLFFELLVYTSILWIASSELLNWMDIANTAHSYKLGLSILWGLYALLLIGIGIWKKKKQLRIGAIALFGVTLVKLFLYDIAHLDTISKTIVLVALGVLLLLISFLYNKYKHIIADETEN